MTYRTDIPCGDGGTVCEVPDAQIDDTVTYSKMFDKPIEVFILEVLMHKRLQTDEMIIMFSFIDDLSLGRSQLHTGGRTMCFHEK